MDRRHYVVKPVVRRHWFAITQTNLKMRYFTLILSAICSAIPYAMTQTQSMPDSLSNWSQRSRLPLVVAETLPPEVKGPSLRMEDGDISYRDSTVLDRSGERVPDSLEAERISRSFISKFYPSYSKTLMLSSVSLNKTGWPPKIDPDSLLIVSFRSVWNGMPIYSSGVNVYLFGSKVEGARFYTWVVKSIVQDSERQVIPRDSALTIWKSAVAKYYNVTAEPKFAELQYYYFPEDNLEFNSNRYILRPHWVFDDSDLVVDAFDGTFWRND